MLEFTYYCGARYLFASYPLLSLLRLCREHNWRMKLREPASAPAPVRSAMLDPDWQEAAGSRLVFSARSPDREITFCIDCHDSAELDRARGVLGYHLPLLRAVDVYFKENVNRSAIQNTSELQEFAAKITQGPLVMPVRLPARTAGQYFWNERPSSWRKFRLSVSNHRTLTPMSQLVDARNSEKSRDFFYLTSFRAGEVHRQERAFRHDLMLQLQTITGYQSSLGYGSDSALPQPYESFRTARVSSASYADLLASSKLAVYCRGLHGCVSSKFALSCCLGVAMVGQPLMNRDDWYSEYPELSSQLTYETAEEITLRVTELLADSNELYRLGRSNLEFFRKQLSPSALGSRLLDGLGLAGALRR